MNSFKIKHKEDNFEVSLNAIDFEDAVSQVTKSGVTKKEDWEFVSKGDPYIYKYIRHVVSEMDGGVQRCVICGDILSDYRNTMTDKPGEKISGFPPGNLFVSESKNPTVFMIDIPEDDYHTFKDCKQ